MLAIKKYLNPRITGIVLLQHFGRKLPDKLYLKLLFRLHSRRCLNLKDPKTYNEKLQWLKLYNRQPEYTMMVDKYAVKEYVANLIGSEYVIPTLGVWNKPEQIDWDSLPNQFVLKTTHGGGSSGVLICKDKSKFEKKKAIEKLNASMKQDIYGYLKEWPYKNVTHRIIAEKYIEIAPDVPDLPDYKFFCFNGEVKALFVATDRQTVGVDVKFDFFDANYNHLPFRQGHDNAKNTPKKPKNFEQMKMLAGKLSYGIPHMRVDFYDLGDRILFGEITFFHFSGMMPFEPEEWDYEFGKWLNLPRRTS